jgi:Kef-type K+ transport system membrane component KefB
MYLTTPALKDTINVKNDHVEFCSSNMGSKIFLSMCPMILLFGTFTNILSLLVLSRKRMRKHSTYVYLAILSVIDLLALWLGITRDFLAHGFNIHIRALWLCKIALVSILLYARYELVDTRGRLVRSLRSNNIRFLVVY